MKWELDPLSRNYEIDLDNGISITIPERVCLEEGILDIFKKIQDTLWEFHESDNFDNSIYVKATKGVEKGELVYTDSFEDKVDKIENDWIVAGSYIPYDYSWKRDQEEKVRLIAEGMSMTENSEWYPREGDIYIITKNRTLYEAHDLCGFKMRIEKVSDAAVQMRSIVDPTISICEDISWFNPELGNVERIIDGISRKKSQIKGSTSDMIIVDDVEDDLGLGSGDDYINYKKFFIEEINRLSQQYDLVLNNIIYWLEKKWTVTDYSYIPYDDSWKRNQDHIEGTLKDWYPEVGKKYKVLRDIENTSIKENDKAEVVGKRFIGSHIQLKTKHGEIEVGYHTFDPKGEDYTFELIKEKDTFDRNFEKVEYTPTEVSITIGGKPIDGFTKGNEIKLDKIEHNCNDFKKYVETGFSNSQGYYICSKCKKEVL